MTVAEREHDDEKLVMISDGEKDRMYSQWGRYSSEDDVDV